MSAEQYMSNDSPQSGEAGVDQFDPLLVFSDVKWRELQTRTEELKAERVMHKNKFK